jgi:hypothetical protein
VAAVAHQTPDDGVFFFQEKSETSANRATLVACCLSVPPQHTPYTVAPQPNLTHFFVSRPKTGAAAQSRAWGQGPHGRTAASLDGLHQSAGYPRKPKQPSRRNRSSTPSRTIIPGEIRDVRHRNSPNELGKFLVIVCKHWLVYLFVRIAHSDRAHRPCGLAQFVGKFLQVGNLLPEL